jgi:hypothetical protein
VCENWYYLYSLSIWTSNLISDISMYLCAEKIYFCTKYFDCEHTVHGSRNLFDLLETYLRRPQRLVALKQVEGTVVVAGCEARSCLIWADLTVVGLWGWHGPPTRLVTPWHQPSLKACKYGKWRNYLISMKWT